MEAESPVVTLQRSMTVNPAQMMCPVNQTIVNAEANFLGIKCVVIADRKARHAVTCLYYQETKLPLAVLHLCLPAERETQSVVPLRSSDSHWPLICHAAVESISTQLPWTQHLIHAEPLVPQGKAKGERRVEQRSDRWMDLRRMIT